MKTLLVMASCIGFVWLTAALAAPAKTLTLRCKGPGDVDYTIDIDTAKATVTWIAGSVTSSDMTVKATVDDRFVIYTNPNNDAPIRLDRRTGVQSWGGSGGWHAVGSQCTRATGIN